MRAAVLDACGGCPRLKWPAANSLRTSTDPLRMIHAQHARPPFSLLAPDLLVLAGLVFSLLLCGLTPASDAQQPPADAEPDGFARYGIYAATAPHAAAAEPLGSELPLRLQAGDRIALIGNTLLERSQHFGYFETLLQQRFAAHRLTVRNLAWPADTLDLQPRPENFASTQQHLYHERADVILAAFGFNESFAGIEGLPAFRETLSRYVAELKSKAFNGRSAPRLILLSPIGNENVAGVPAADLNNARIAAYSEAMAEVARQQEVGFVDLFAPTRQAMQASGYRLPEHLQHQHHH